jgi:prepilin-type N-terminal cleavage/methylation domain-containing protein
MVKASPKGVTLIEVITVLALLGVLMTAWAYSFNPILMALSSQQDRMGLNMLQSGLEKAASDLRSAVALQNDPNKAIRYTLRESGVVRSYILYLYHPSDSWPPNFTQSTYQLRKASLTGGISGTFSYGSGDLILRDVVPPPLSDLSAAGSVATMDVTLKKGDETFRLLCKVKRRAPG